MLLHVGEEHFVEEGTGAAVLSTSAKGHSVEKGIRVAISDTGADSELEEHSTEENVTAKVEGDINSKVAPLHTV